MPSNPNGYEIEFYVNQRGEEVVTSWLQKLDLKTRARIRTRFDRIEAGNLGDHKNVGSEIYELRYHFGSGYRIYLGIDEGRIVVLLIGGDKRTQNKDIKKANANWEHYKDDSY